ncbi:MAG: FprA family A-type flavoprotein [Aquificae bacterium]|nr:FprA family A-type flavoprotein [Aquificota bacterium]
MSGRVLFEENDHKIVLFEELTPASAVQANQYLIVHKGEAMLLDPGGHKVFSQLQRDISRFFPPSQIKYIFLSHQDPDVVASINGWLLTTNAQALISRLWIRFLPHFGLDSQLENRVIPIEDRGMRVKLGDCELIILPAHFLHSPGNFQVYDPCSKTLFSGDLGASLGSPYVFVEDFDAHLRYMEPFHKRYMASRKVMNLWADMVSELDIEMIAPQHGAVFKGKGMVERFINWARELPCGVDLMDEGVYSIPGG